MRKGRVDVLRSAQPRVIDVVRRRYCVLSRREKWRRPHLCAFASFHSQPVRIRSGTTHALESVSNVSEVIGEGGRTARRGSAAEELGRSSTPAVPYNGPHLSDRRHRPRRNGAAGVELRPSSLSVVASNHFKTLSQTTCPLSERRSTDRCSKKSDRLLIDPSCRKESPRFMVGGLFLFPDGKMGISPSLTSCNRPMSIDTDYHSHLHGCVQCGPIFFRNEMRGLDEEMSRHSRTRWRPISVRGESVSHEVDDS